ncbi:hypothetical protein IOD16_06755 [Saccharothrix sp. 6-C]|uniref:hypothetical protein n=1 Tax=Saccharothrix sp. 6-C TaxID=2781735 RepID=UPI001916CEB1|nr:hypothetical protein [Saccharothrix sp. 6-C]QQQ78165.1 hypothetical protein IOD16_06755 [Saccharothrix sp. 6-C]
MRIESRPDGWYATWAFSINEGKARKEKYEAHTLTGPLIVDYEFPGCPQCRASSFVLCRLCGKFSCWSRDERGWHCGWPPCRSYGTPEGTIESFAAIEDR